MSDSPISPDEVKGHRPTWAEVDLGALSENYQEIKRRVGPGVKVMPVVKANAYGHGAIACAKRLRDEGAEWFGVALPEEGIELRIAGVNESILCLAGFWEGQAALCLQHKLVPTVYRLETISALDQAARDAGVIADVHLKIDTGMGRLGVRFDEAGEFLEALGKFRNIRVDGLMTHFAAADDPSCEPLTENQIARFENVVAFVRSRGHRPTNLHCANSAGIFSHPESLGNMVRPGGALYGMWRDVLPPSDEGKALRPVMSLRSRIMLLKWVPAGETIGYGCTYEASRKTLVATVPVGYEDGYRRGLSNRGRVIVRGSFAPVVGRISMDLTIVDVTSVPGVRLGDVVTLFGVESRSAEAGVGARLAIPVEDVAKTAGVFSYEMTCGIGPRVPRVYV
ncbi:MAG TPA: alanine racemase [Pyrinomonadaceae bacterium]|nr:alanine racemase [Pyrinomonadaceae bacterium]